MSEIADPLITDLLGIVKGVQHGIWYGTKLRFCHALVMTFAYRSGSLESKIKHILTVTRQHATALGSFAFIYKSILLIIKLLRQYFYRAQPSQRTKITNREGGLDSFIAGLISGYFVFGKTNNSVTEQMVLYVFSRSILGGANQALGQNYKSRTPLANKTWVAVAALSWASVMTLFRVNPDSLQTSMLHSMQYIFVDSEAPEDDLDSGGL